MHKSCVLRHPSRSGHMTPLFTFSFELEDLFWAAVCRDKIGGFSFRGLSREKTLKDHPQSPRGVARFVWGQH